MLNRYSFVVLFKNIERTHYTFRKDISELLVELVYLSKKGFVGQIAVLHNFAIDLEDYDILLAESGGIYFVCMNALKNRGSENR